jgi:hypothetical protein
MYSLTSQEINSSTTTDMTNNVRGTTQGGAVGSSRQGTSRSMNFTPILSLCSSSTSTGIVKITEFMCVRCRWYVLRCDFVTQLQPLYLLS